MNAMTNQQNTRIKSAVTFTKTLLGGVLIAAPEDFIKAKEAELCIEHHCSSVSINTSLTISFNDLLKNYGTDQICFTL